MLKAWKLEKTTKTYSESNFSTAKKNIGTLSAVVGQTFPLVPQINVSRQTYGPNIDGGEWGGIDKGAGYEFSCIA